VKQTVLMGDILGHGKERDRAISNKVGTVNSCVLRLIVVLSLATLYCLLPSLFIGFGPGVLSNMDFKLRTKATLLSCPILAVG